jgi:hypothetical protein
MSIYSSTNFLIEVKKGNIAGHELIHKFGWRGNVTTTHHHLWNDPANNSDMTFPTAAETFDVITTGQDTTAGTGCREILITYLDSSFNIQTGTVTTNGGTQASAFSGIRLLSAWATDNGTYGGSNQNAITIKGTTSGNNYAFIQAGEGQTQNSQYCIPNGKTGYLLNSSITIEANKPANIIFYKRNDADVIAAPFTSSRLVHQWDGIDVPVNENFNANHILTEKTDVWVGCDMVTGTGIIQFDYDILLVDN